MKNIPRLLYVLPVFGLLLAALDAEAQTFRVQCPAKTSFHPGAATDAGAVKCQQLSGGDGFATMGDGTQTYIFSFGPLSGIKRIRDGLEGTTTPDLFNVPGDLKTIIAGILDPNFTGDPSTNIPANTDFNGAVGLVADPDATDPNNPLTGHVDPRPIMDVGVLNGNMPAPMIAIDEDDELFLTLTNVGMIMRPDLFEQHTVHFHGYPNASAYYDGVPDASVAINIGGSFTYYYLAPDAGTYFWHCHITPPEHLQMGMVGQLFVRPRQNKFGTTPETAGMSLFQGLQAQQNDLRTKCGTDILCSSPLPPTNNVNHLANKSGAPTLYAYNDGDGSTAYDVEYPIQIHGFDPNFHFVGMTFNPEAFSDLKDKYFLLNGRSYPDTVTPGTMTTQVSDGTSHASQPLPSIINIPAGGKALLRISDLDVTEYQTLASLGIPMHVVGLNARLLRDLAGTDMSYNTNSITLAGGESIDVILDACQVRASDGSCTTAYNVGDTYYLYTPNLDHLANDAENFGGLMTEVHICKTVDPITKACPPTAAAAKTASL